MGKLAVDKYSLIPLFAKQLLCTILFEMLPVLFIEFSVKNKKKEEGNFSRAYLCSQLTQTGGNDLNRLI